MNEIVIKNVSKTIKNTVVLNDINLSFKSGDCILLRGRNGSGKTMLLNLIAGFLKPTSGELLQNGKLVRKDIHFLQNASIILDTIKFDEYLSGLENIKIIQKISNKGTEQSIENSFKRIGLDYAKDMKVKKYSLGMNKRLEIVQALFEDNDILLLDEPTNALDDEGVALFNDILKEEKKKGKIIIVASHNQDDFQDIFTAKYSMSGGKCELLEKK